MNPLVTIIFKMIDEYEKLDPRECAEEYAENTRKIVQDLAENNPIALVVAGMSLNEDLCLLKSVPAGGYPVTQESKDLLVEKGILLANIANQDPKQMKNKFLLLAHTCPDQEMMDDALRSADQRISELLAEASCQMGQA